MLVTKPKQFSGFTTEAYLTGPFQIIVMLHGSPDYKFVIVEDFGIVSSYAPRTVFGDVQTMVVVSTWLEIIRRSNNL